MKRPILLLLLLLFFLACNPFERTILIREQTLDAIPTATPYPTNTPVFPTFPSILEENGFVIKPPEGGCAGACVVYGLSDPFILVRLYAGPYIEIFSNTNDTEILYPLVTKLFNEDITKWIDENIPVMLSEDKYQKGVVGDYEITISQEDNGARMWIDIIKNK
jgi:hypothetical protein